MGEWAARLWQKPTPAAKNAKKDFPVFSKTSTQKYFLVTSEIWKAHGSIDEASPQYQHHRRSNIFLADLSLWTAHHIFLVSNIWFLTPMKYFVWNIYEIGAGWHDDDGKITTAYPLFWPNWPCPHKTAGCHVVPESLTAHLYQCTSHHTSSVKIRQHVSKLAWKSTPVVPVVTYINCGAHIHVCTSAYKSYYPVHNAPLNKKLPAI